MLLFRRSRTRLALRGALLVILLAPLALHAQTGDPTSSQNQGIRAVGGSAQPDPDFVGTSLFAYGPTYSSDQAMPASDDGNVSLNSSFSNLGPEGLSLSLAFAGQKYSTTYVNVNGFATFGSAKTGSFTPSELSNVTTPMVAAYWADADIRASTNPNTPSGNVWYRTTQDTAELSSIATRVEGAFAGVQGFNPLFAQIITWDKVGRFGGGSEPDNTKVNTFQLVIASDGVNTYSLVLYPKEGIWWDYGTASGGAYPAMGYTGANGIDLAEAPGSRTYNMRDTWFRTNTADNTGGTWAFNVSGTLAPIVVNGTYSPSPTGSATSTLRFSANASGHTITGDPVATRTLAFGQLRFDDPANQVTFGDHVIALATSPDAIIAGNLVFADHAVLVVNATNALNGGAITLRDHSRISIFAANTGTGDTTLSFDPVSGSNTQVDLRGFDTTLGALTSTNGAGLITNSGGTTTLTLGGDANGSFSGRIQDGTGILNLARTGTGIQILTGTSAYTGTTTISGGTLLFAAPSAFYNGTLDATTAAKLTLQADGLAAFRVGGAGEFTSNQFYTLLSHANFSGGAVGVDATNAPGGSFALTDNLSGPIGLGVAGSGTLILSGSNTHTGSTVLAGGTLALASNTALGSGGSITFSGGTLQYSAANTNDYSARFSTAANQHFVIDTNGQSVTFASALTGAGTLTLSAANTYAPVTTTLNNVTTYSGGTTTVAAGTLRLSGSGRLADTTFLTVASGATFDLNNVSDTIGGLAGAGNVALGAGTLTVNDPRGISTNRSSATFSGILSGTGGLIKNGLNSDLILTGDNTYTGITTVSSGILQLGDGGTTGSVAGDIVNNYLLYFNRSNEFTYAGIISGSGNVVKVGTGTLTLSGANTYTGYTSVGAGTLRLAGSARLADTAPLFVSNGATFDLNNLTDTVGYASGAGTIALGTGSLITASDTSLGSFSGNFSGSGSFTKGGTGTLTINGVNANTNAFTGSTIIAAGTIALSGSGRLSDDTALTVNSGATFNLNNLSDTIGSLAGAGNVILGTGTLSAGGNQTSTTFSGVISGSGGLAKSGSGTLTLSGTNTYTGATTISDGALQLGTGGTTGSTAGNIVNNAALVFNRSDAVTFANVISGTGAVTQSGTGTLTLSGDNTYSGGTTVSAGTLRLSGSARLSDTALLTVASGATFDLNGLTDTVGSLAGAGGVTLGAGALTAGGDNTNTTFSGIASGTGTLTKAGTGTLTLSGANTYSGATTISGGTLQIGAGGTTGSLTGNIANNAALAFNRSDASTYAGVISGTGTLTKSGTGTLILSGANTYSGATTISGGTLQIGAGGTTGSVAGNIANNAALAFNRSDTVTFANVISGSGSLTQAGSGILILSGANTYSGATTVSTGSLRLSGSARLSDSASLTVASGATFDLNGLTDTVGSLAGAGGVTLGAGALTAGSDNTNTTFSGIASGTGTLTKSGTGTLTLTGANTYSGGTTISGGTLQIGAGGTTGSIAGNITNNAALAFNRSDALTYAGVISGTGTLTKAGAGTLTLANANTFSGNTTISAGTLALGHSLALQNSPVTLAGAGTLSFGSLTAASLGGLSGGNALALSNGSSGVALTVGAGGASTTYTGILSGSGSLTKVGAGTLTLTGANTYTGGTTVSAGTLAGDSTSLRGSIVNNATLQFDQATDGTFDGTLSGSGILAKSGAGTLTLLNPVNPLGGAVVTAGTLRLDGDLAINAVALGQSGVFQVAQGDVSVGTLQTYEASTVAVTGGSLTTGDLLIGGTETAKLNIAGGTVTVSGYTVIGTSDGSGADATMSGGSLDTLGFYVGTGAGRGTLALSGGTISVGADSHIGFDTYGEVASDVSVSGGSWTTAGGLILGQNGIGSLTLTGGTVTAGFVDLTSSFASNRLAIGGTGVLETSTILGPGEVTMAGGTLRTTDNGVLTTNSVELQSGNSTIDTQGYSNTLAQPLVGAGGLVKSGTGTLTLSGANTYSGATTVSAGTLRLSGSARLHDFAPLTVATGATLDFNDLSDTIGSLAGGGTVALGAGSLTAGGNGASTTFSGVVSGAGGLTKTGAGTLTLSGANTYTGGTTISAGTLQIGAGGNTGSLAGNIANHAALAFNRSDAFTYAGVISGTGTLTKLGTGTLILSGANSYSGGTAINAGRLALDGANAIGNSGTISFGGGILQFSATNTLDYSARFSNATGQVYALDTNGQHVTLASALGGAGNALTKFGAGTLTLTGAHTYTGATTVSAGTLALQGSLYDQGATAGTVVVEAGGTLLLQASDVLGRGASNSPARLTIQAGGLVLNDDARFNTFTGLTLNGGELRAGTGSSDTFPVYQLKGTVTVGGTTASAITTTGGAFSAITLGNNTDGGVTTFLVNDVTGDAGADLTIAPVLANGNAGSPTFTIVASGLNKTGTGTLVLTGTNTYTGATTVDAGTLLVNGSLAQTAVAVASGATLGGSGTIGGLTTINSGAHLAPGNSPGVITFTHGLTFNEGAILDFQLGDPLNAATSDRIDVTGGTLSGPTTGLITLNLSDAGGFGAGTYDLIRYSGATYDDASLTLANFDLPTTLSGFSLAYAFTGSALQLTATAVPEPATYALLIGAGTLVLAALRRRRNAYKKI